MVTGTDTWLITAVEAKPELNGQRCSVKDLGNTCLVIGKRDSQAVAKRSYLCPHQMKDKGSCSGGRPV